MWRPILAEPGRFESRATRGRWKETTLPQRVTTRPPSASDQGEFLRAARASRKLHGAFVHPPDSQDAYRAWLKRIRRDSHESRLVIEAAGGAIAGVVNLNEIVRGALQSAYLGYYAFEPFSGQGYMRAGLTAVIREAFRELGLHRVEANIQPDNAASIGLVHSLGFRKEGFSPRYLKIAGRWRDHERWALIREDRSPSRKSPTARSR